jgi:HlyD family secretion protein
MKRIIWITAAIGTLALLVYTMVYLYGKSQQKPVTYRTEQPYKADIVRKTMATGSVKPRKEVDIKPVVSGIVEQLYVEPGQLVKAGDLLARVRIIPDMVNLNNAENRLERARIAMDNARIDFERNEKLLKNGVIAYAEFQPFEIALRNARAELDAAEDNLKIVREGVSKKNSAAANTLIRSTIDGMVLDVPTEVGKSVIEVNNFNEGTTIATIADMTDLIFEGKIDESEVGKVREGMELILTIGALENQTFTAVLEYISPKGKEENGAIQFDIKAAVSLPANTFIRAGYSANASVVLDKRSAVLAINEALLQYENDSIPYVEVATGEQKFEKRRVRLGLSDGIQVEVLDGVKEGDEIKRWNQPITD